MMPARNYRDFFAWEKALALVLSIYEETSQFPNEERYGITSQLRKAGISIPSNMAEGEERKSSSEFRYFLSIALGSLKDAETQILISEALGYFRPNQTSRLMAKSAK